MDCFYTVIYTLPSGRMALCDHTHSSLEQAIDCSTELNEPISIFEWDKNRRPQFKEAFRFEIAKE